MTRYKNVKIILTDNIYKDKNLIVEEIKSLDFHQVHKFKIYKIINFSNNLQKILQKLHTK